MTLKKQSFIISFGSITVIVVVIAVMIYGYVLSGFQTVENQRVERNIKSLEISLIDKHKQLSSKLADWAIWDDSYYFMINRNQKYKDSNLVQESLEKTGIGEMLFIDSNGALVESFLVSGTNKEENFPEDIYSHFATGSALTKIDKNEEQKSGILSTEDGMLFFSVAQVLKSDGSGPAHGIMVFATYFNAKMLTTIKELTQFNTTFVRWGDTSMSSDFLEAKAAYTGGKKQQTKILNTKIIAGYLIVEDIYGKPQGILRIDVERDITIQGKESMVTIMTVLICFGLIGAFINFWLVNGVVLKKILTISTELKNIGDENNSKKRLLTTTTNKDELDVLRVNINTMLEDIEESQKKLRFEMGKQESILELIDASVVILDPKACVAQINRKGYEALGYSQKELIGVDWIEHVILPEQRDLMKKKFDEIMSSSMTNNSYIENSLLTKDKKVVTYAWHNTIIKDSKGVILSTVSVGTDITVQKQEEKVKEDYITTLKRLNELMVGRELKMIELKEKLKQYETA